LSTWSSVDHPFLANAYDFLRLKGTSVYWAKVVTVLPNLPYIVRFGPYRPHGFVLGDTSSHLSLMPQNTYDKLATITLNKASYQSLTR